MRTLTEGKNALSCAFDLVSNNDLFCSDGAVYIDTPSLTYLARLLSGLQA
jgi:hypothetical protein